MAIKISIGATKGLGRAAARRATDPNAELAKLYAADCAQHGELHWDAYVQGFWDEVVAMEHPESYQDMEESPSYREAIEKYREFHRLDPKKVGRFPPGFKIPRSIYKAGCSKWVTYRSNKVDPETLLRPRKPINYIHEHDAGVVTYVTDPQGGHDAVDVPQEFRGYGALVLLGFCLGFAFEHDGEEQEVEGRSPLPELYTVPSGKCLIVIQSKRDVLAMMWGGALGVFARGIDG